jgi:DNA-binding NarL/FixJ family response regulator
MKVYIVEDDEGMRIILKRLMKKNFSSITAIGESLSADDALREIPVFAPDILLVDISLPGMDGLELISKLKPQCRKAGIIVLTGHEIDQYREIALNAGAHGIVSKMDDNGLLQTIREILHRRDEAV